MGLKLSGSNSTIEVIAFIDESVTCSREEYDAYLKTLDESLLQIDAAKEPPVKFVMKKNLRLDHLQKVKEVQTTVKDSKIHLNLSYMLLEIKYALVDVIGGEGVLKYRKSSDGGASDELISVLDSSGILNDLVAARNAAVQPADKASSKKS
jgi:hypothetical protein